MQSLNPDGQRRVLEGMWASRLPLAYVGESSLILRAISLNGKEPRTRTKITTARTFLHKVPSLHSCHFFRPCVQSAEIHSACTHLWSRCAHVQSWNLWCVLLWCAVCLTLFQYLTCSVVLQALGASDYLEMARLFDTVLIRRVPMLTLSMKDQARRFTTLIDNFYDKKVKTKKRMKGMDSITLMCYRRISNAAFLPLFTTFRNLPTLHP